MGCLVGTSLGTRGSPEFKVSGLVKPFDLGSIPNLCLSLKYRSSAKNVLPTGYIIMNVYPASTWKKLLSEVEPNTITRSAKDLTVKLIS